MIFQLLQFQLDESEKNVVNRVVLFENKIPIISSKDCFFDLLENLTGK